MIEIKTITENTTIRFDRKVNTALSDGWELVRRDVFITGSDCVTTFYAELERMIEETDEPVNESFIATWAVSRDPSYPYKCTSCGCKVQEPLAICPHCNKIMMGDEE